MARNKPKLMIKEQVDHLENKKGVKFAIVNKKDAIKFLSYNNYFFKLKSYCKNYDKKPNGMYINLEFAYLRELSTLDMHFRRFVMRITTDIEHILKTKLMRDFSQNNQCDGYKIIEDFFKQNPKIHKEISNYNHKGYTPKDNILKKYKTNLAIWNLIEIIEFGKFIKLCNFYYDKYPDRHFDKIKNLLWSVKCLRNSSAHNNCLFHSLRALNSSEFRRNFEVTNWLENNISMSKNSIKSKMQNPSLHDFVVCLVVYNDICNKGEMKRMAMVEFKKLQKRAKRHKDFFIKNTLLTSSFVFIRKVTHSLYESYYRYGKLYFMSF